MAKDGPKDTTGVLNLDDADKLVRRRPISSFRSIEAELTETAEAVVVTASEQIQLELPNWLPQPIAAHAQQIFRNSAREMSEQLLICRLTSDSRMKRVWTELLKRKRINYKRSEEYRYPATFPKNWSHTARAKLRRARTLRSMGGPLNEHEAKKQEVHAALYQTGELVTLEKGLSTQALALICFFDQAFEFARNSAKPVPRVIAQKKRAHYLNMAKRIREDVKCLKLPDQDLMKAVFAYEELADRAAPPPGHPLFVDRKRGGDDRQTGFVIELVDAATAIFGMALHGVVAIVTNVAFECDDWDAERVRKAAKTKTPPLTPRFTAT